MICNKWEILMQRRNHTNRKYIKFIENYLPAASLSRIVFIRHQFNHSSLIRHLIRPSLAIHSINYTSWIDELNGSLRIPFLQLSFTYIHFIEFIGICRFAYCVHASLRVSLIPLLPFHYTQLTLNPFHYITFLSVNSRCHSITRIDSDIVTSLHSVNSSSYNPCKLILLSSGTSSVHYIHFIDS